MTIRVNKINKNIIISLIFLSFILILFIAIIFFYYDSKFTKITRDKELLITELQTSLESITTLKKDFSKLDIENKELSQVKEKISKEKEDLNYKFTEEHNKNSYLLADYNQLLKEKSELDQTQKTLASEKLALIEQIKTLESESFIKDTLKQKTLLEIKVKKLEEEIKNQNIKTKIEISKAQQDAETELANYKKEINSLKKDMMTKTQEQKDIDTLKEEILRQTRQITELKESLDAVSQEKEEVANKLSQQLANEKNLNNMTEIKIEEQTKTFSEQQNKFNELANEKAYLEKQIQNLIENTQMKNTQIDKLKTELENTNKTLNLRMQELARSKDLIEDIISKSHTAVTEYQKDKPITDTKQSLENYTSLMKQVAAPETTTPTQTDSAHMHFKTHNQSEVDRNMKANIIEVDYKYSFIVIDAGANQGIDNNTSFKIYQNNQQIAEGRVLEIRKDFTAATITVFDDNIVRKGDIALII